MDEKPSRQLLWMRANRAAGKCWCGGEPDLPLKGCKACGDRRRARVRKDPEAPVRRWRPLPEGQTYYSRDKKVVDNGGK